MVWAMLVIASEVPFKTLMGTFIACEKTPFMGVARNQMAFSHMSCLGKVSKKNIFLGDFVQNVGPHPPTANVWDSTK